MLDLNHDKVQSLLMAWSGTESLMVDNNRSGGLICNINNDYYISETGKKGQRFYRIHEDWKKDKVVYSNASIIACLNHAKRELLAS